MTGGRAPLGQHTDEVFAAVGYRREIAALRTDGIVR